jgi:hypothetical protein
MTDVSIEIKGKKLEFGLSLFRILGRKWQLPGVNEVIKKWQSLLIPEKTCHLIN